jgi:hypothetical protein
MVNGTEAPMRAGDSVVYLPHVELFGIGKVTRTLSNGRLRVRFSDDTIEDFGPQELETYDRWKQRAKVKA